MWIKNFDHAQAVLELRAHFAPFFSEHGFSLVDERVSDEDIGLSQLDFRKAAMLVNVQVYNHWEYQLPYLNVVFVEQPNESEWDCIPLWRILRDHGQKDASQYEFSSQAEFGSVCTAAVDDLRTHALLVMEGQADVLESHRKSHRNSRGNRG